MLLGDLSDVRVPALGRRTDISSPSRNVVLSHPSSATGTTDRLAHCGTCSATSPAATAAVISTFCNSRILASVLYSTMDRSRFNAHDRNRTACPIYTRRCAARRGSGRMGPGLRALPRRYDSGVGYGAEQDPSVAATRGVDRCIQKNLTALRGLIW